MVSRHLILPWGTLFILRSMRGPQRLFLKNPATPQPVVTKESKNHSTLDVQYDDASHFARLRYVETDLP
jgi:hypothetical protein